MVVKQRRQPVTLQSMQAPLTREYVGEQLEQTEGTAHRRQLGKLHEVHNPMVKLNPIEQVEQM